MNTTRFIETQQAAPTGRLLAHGEEWVSYGTCDGVDVACYYTFDTDDVTWDDGSAKLPEDYPWDSASVRFEEI